MGTTANYSSYSKKIIAYNYIKNSYSYVKPVDFATLSLITPVEMNQSAMLPNIC